MLNRLPKRSARLIPAALWTCLVGGIALAQVPPHLDILSAGIEELPPIDGANVSGRAVSLRLEVNGAPVCNAATGFLAYGFLIDADSNSATGTSDAAFDDLGIDARITAVCDPAAGLFGSPVGAVTLTPGPGTTTIEIRTTVAHLPSLAFRWIAFAQEGTVFSRLPQAPEYGYWTTHEKGVY